MIQGNKALGAAVEGYGNGGGVFVTTSYYDESEIDPRPWLLAGRLAARLFGEHGCLQSTASDANIINNEATRWGGGLYAGISFPWYGNVLPGNYDEVKIALGSVKIKNNTAGTQAIDFPPRTAAQVAFERAQDAISTYVWGGPEQLPIPGSPVLDLIGTQLDGNAQTDIGIFYLDSIMPLTDATTTYGSLDTTIQYRESP